MRPPQNPACAGFAGLAFENVTLTDVLVPTLPADPTRTRNRMRPIRHLPGGEAERVRCGGVRCADGIPVDLERTPATLLSGSDAAALNVTSGQVGAVPGDVTETSGGCGGPCCLAWLRLATLSSR